jgi:hypothetical protein
MTVRKLVYGKISFNVQHLAFFNAASSDGDPAGLLRAVLPCACIQTSADVSLIYLDRYIIALTSV